MCPDSDRGLTSVPGQQHGAAVETDERARLLGDPGQEQLEGRRLVGRARELTERGQP
jgi:hypothetical protein